MPKIERSRESTLGASVSKTELGPPDRMMPLGVKVPDRNRMPRAGHADLAVAVGLSHTPRDQLGELGPEVEDQDAAHARYHVVGSRTSPRIRSSTVSRARAT